MTQDSDDDTKQFPFAAPSGAQSTADGGTEQQDNLQRTAKKADPLISKTRLDLDACRKVMDRMVTGQNVKLKHNKMGDSVKPLYKQPVVASSSRVSFSELPKHEALSELFSQLNTDPEKLIEANWTSADKTAHYSLYVKGGATGRQPEWCLCSHIGDKTTTLFTHVSSDVLLIYNLVASSCGQLDKTIDASGTFYVTQQVKGLTGNQESFVTSPVAADRPRGAQAEAAPDSGASSFSGDLATTHMADVVNALRMAQMTGRLRLKDGQREGDLYVDNGVPVDARAEEFVGDEGAVLLMTWHTGQYNFMPNSKSVTKTVLTGWDELFVRASVLLEKSLHLQGLGLSSDSIIVRKRTDLSEGTYQKLSQELASLSSSAIDLPQQKKLYDSIDDRSTISEIALKTGMSRSQWVPLLCSLITWNFVSIRNSG